MSLNGEITVIIGGSSGMGLATAQRLVAGGGRVIITGRSQSKLDAAMTTIDGDVTAEAFDARNSSALEAFFAKAASFDHLVLSMSSGAVFKPFEQIEEDALRQTFENKYWPFVNALRFSLGRLSAEGSITLITGSAARKAAKGMSAIAATNGALLAMIGPLALELAPRRVNAVCPGLVDSPYWDGVEARQKEEMFAWSAGRVPVGRVGLPGDIAQAVTYLISNTFTTGTILDCDGGVHVT